MPIGAMERVLISQACVTKGWGYMSPHSIPMVGAGNSKEGQRLVSHATPTAAQASPFPGQLRRQKPPKLHQGRQGGAQGTPSPTHPGRLPLLHTQQGTGLGRRIPTAPLREGTAPTAPARSRGWDGDGLVSTP